MHRVRSLIHLVVPCRPLRSGQQQLRSAARCRWASASGATFRSSTRMSTGGPWYIWTVARRRRSRDRLAPRASAPWLLQCSSLIPPQHLRMCDLRSSSLLHLVCLDAGGIFDGGDAYCCRCRRSCKRWTTTITGSTRTCTAVCTILQQRRRRLTRQPDKRSARQLRGCMLECQPVAATPPRHRRATASSVCQCERGQLVTDHIWQRQATSLGGKLSANILLFRWHHSSMRTAGGRSCSRATQARLSTWSHTRGAPPP